MPALAANEGDTRRLTEIVRSLAGDRERLLARLATIERGLEDVTGSVHKQAASTPPAAPPPPPPRSGRRTAAEDRGRAAADGCPVRAGPGAAGARPAVPRTRSRPPRSPNWKPIPGRPAAGVDVGGAKDFDGLRTLWNTISANYSDLFEGLNPIVSVRENNKSRGAELRLVAGPITDVESASRICTTLAAAKRYCRLVTFEGQPLAMNGTAPPRRPAASRRGHWCARPRRPDCPSTLARP